MTLLLDARGRFSSITQYQLLATSSVEQYHLL